MEPNGDGARFATAITCMDGRIQQSVVEWTRRRFGVDYVDMLTVAGPDRAVGDDQLVGTRLLSDAVLSQQAHGSEFLVLASHSDCAANPVSGPEHERMVRAGVDWLGERLPGMTVIGIHIGFDWPALNVVEVTGSSLAAR